MLSLTATSRISRGEKAIPIILKNTVMPSHILTNPAICLDNAKEGMDIPSHITSPHRSAGTEKAIPVIAVISYATEYVMLLRNPINYEVKYCSILTHISVTGQRASDV
jgi:hypothetical protein